MRIARARGPILRFHGRLIGELELGGRSSGNRWIELRLWETPVGTWVVERVQASDEAGERDFASAWTIPTDLSDDARRVAVMDALDWSLPSRSLAKQLGWKFEEFLE